jgi:tRNA-binding EMAP/Myf-like protein
LSPIIRRRTFRKKNYYFNQFRTAKFAGEVSDGMLLAAENENHSKCVILTVDKEIEVGARIS